LRYRLMATYHGAPFEAGIGPTDGDIVLFAACPPPEELGFEPATGHWRKQLHLADVQAVWESRPVGKFRGERCMVLDDLGDRLHIGFLGHDGYKAEQLGYWQVDRGVFELVAPRTEVSEILEERTEYGRPGDSAGLPKPQPAPEPAGYRGQDWHGSSGSSGYLPPSADAPEPASYGAPAEPPAPAYSWQADQPSGPFGAGPAMRPADPQAIPAPAYRPVPDGITGVALPVAAEAPLPLEAEALRAASAARRPSAAQRLAAAPPSPSAAIPAPPQPAPPQPAPPQPAPVQAGPLQSAPVPAGPGQQADTALPRPAPSRQRRAARRRMATEQLFADLADMAGIPADSYSIGEDAEGALCLVRAGDRFEVFHSAAGARHELQVFASEESACFYLFGVLTAEAVRNGTIGRVPTDMHASPAP
jgi:hypothetical protein